jgi:hypothetical protein
MRLVKFAAVLTGVAVAAITLLARNSLKAIDATAKWADRIGIQIKQFVGLRHAAKLSGVEMNQFQLGMQRVTRRLSEAGMETGEAKAALKELGIDAKKFNKLGTREAILAIADAMANVKTQGDRVRLTFKLLDSEGVGMVNLFRLGSAGIKELEQRAEELGLTFSRLDASKVEIANNAITDMKAAFVGLGNQLAIGISGHLTFAAQQVTRFVLFFRESFVNSVIGVIESATDALDTFLVGLHKGVAATSGFAADIKDTLASFLENIPGRNDLTLGFKLIAGQLRQSADESNKVATRALVNSMTQRGAARGAMDSFLEQFLKDAKEALANFQASGPIPSLGAAGGQTFKVEARQVDLSKVNLGFGGSTSVKGTKVTNPAFESMDASLKKIAAGGFGLAAPLRLP